MTDDERLGREVNRLYWGTDASVADIADRLDISRRALYDAIEPAPAHVPCPECGAQMGYRNRTSRDRGEAVCEACGAEVDVDPGEPAVRSDGRTPASVGSPMSLGTLDASRGLLLGGAVLTGVVVGALIGFIGRRS
jgi:hypothetical protein